MKSSFGDFTPHNSSMASRWQLPLLWNLVTLEIRFLLRTSTLHISWQNYFSLTTAYQVTPALNSCYFWNSLFCQRTTNLIIFLGKPGANVITFISYLCSSCLVMMNPCVNSVTFCQNFNIYQTNGNHQQEKNRFASVNMEVHLHTILLDFPK